MKAICNNFRINSVWQFRYASLPASYALVLLAKISKRTEVDRFLFSINHDNSLYPPASEINPVTYQ